MKTHYDVLNLDKNCSAKEIKESFINLSKKYHPDKNKSVDAHKRFVEVNEAYSVLGKAEQRHQYDMNLSLQSRMESGGTSSYPTNMRTYNHYENIYENIYVRNMRYYDTNHNAINASKAKLVVFCCLLVFIGTGIQLKGILDNRYQVSQQIAASLKESKERNSKLSKEEKLAELRQALSKNKYKDVNVRKE